MEEKLQRVVWQEVREQWILDTGSGGGGGSGGGVGEAAKCGMAKRQGNNEYWTPVVEVVEEGLQSVVLQEDRGTMNIGLSCWR